MTLDDFDLVEAATAITKVAWNSRNGVLEQAIDGAPRVLAPSQEQIEAYWSGPQNYKKRRFISYPPIQDQLDAIWKGEPYTSEMRGAILAIKAKYPKP